MKTKHRKKENIGLIFEVLSTKLSESIVIQDVNMYKNIINICKRNFNNNVLKTELNIFRNILTCNLSNNDVAKDFLDECLGYVSDTNIEEVRLLRQKLYCECASLFGKDFLNEKIDNYKIFASIQQLIDLSRIVKDTDQIKENSILVDSILNHLVDNKIITENTRKFNELDINPDYDGIFVRALKKKFTDIWGDKLNESQKNYLSFYITSFDNNKLLEMSKEILRCLPSKLLVEYNRINDDVYKLKIKNIIEKIENTTLNEITNNEIYFILDCLELETQMSKID